jgi:hypothetical protein
MLKPNKHTHPDHTIISVSLLLLLRLKERQLDEFGSLRSYVKKIAVGDDILFLPALNFLFLLGLINYLPKTDAIEYIGPK